VFLGTPTEVTTGGWPVTPGVTGLSTPVLDSVSRHLFFMDTSTGGIDYVDDSIVPAVAVTNQFLFAPGSPLSQPLVVDSGNQKVYAFSASNGTNAVVAQADTSLSAGSRVVVPVGLSATNRAPLSGDFNEDYYNGLSSTARMYVVGNNSTTNRVPSLFALNFDPNYRLNAVANGPLALATNTAAINSSPVTAFYNSTLGRQFLFVSVSNRCSATITGGCIRTLDVTGGAFPTAANVNNVVFAASGGTGGINIDNVSGASGAASVYYTTMTGATIVKATQAGLQ
jgi:hypothetical protein